jgi:hypothetical protein
MATITEVSLTVGDHSAKREQWDLAVSYSVKFKIWERDAWFQEQVTVMGLGDAGETQLATLSGPAFQATSAAGQDGAAVSQRHSPTFTLDADVLDVRRDLVFGAGSDRVEIHRADRIYAVVRLIPLQPDAGEGRSPIHEHQFGRAS